ncbi:SAM complex subunit SAM50 Ecym_3342 [Eremothecium cymbalariae DBVPG|uniref:Bacterial surface antigen (D15) domain-containing protein n=1 Tax=Eremothecium cymbalariae (strain CBS 270.75 / DBVPG 7215 / KCTC 17166 / NRRL Y-17582) TaxID=931890 RepID=G8JRR2_ERECY|nr:Hypothetical protein Ecym_3342 [Eremothecium cymbalariae DBVPG\
MELDDGSRLVDRIRNNATAAVSDEMSKLDSLQQELEYKRQTQALQELLGKNAFMPIKISSTIVQGPDPIRDNVLQSYLDATIYKASNLNQLMYQSDVLHRLLVSQSLGESVTQTLDCRGTINAPISSIQIPSIFHSNDAPQNLSVLDILHRLQIDPVKRFSAKTGTNIGNGEGDGYLQFQWRNILGGGEKITLDATKGTKTHSSYLLNYTTPVNPWWMGDLTAFKNAVQLGKAELYTRGFKTSLRSMFLDKRSWNHEFNIESVLRTTSNRNPQASDSLLLQCGDDFKNSISHAISRDSRDNAIFPSRGQYIKLFNELSLGTYWKSILEFTDAKSWLDKDFITMSTTIKGGYIANLNSDNKFIHMKDKFHSGGSNDVRGFQQMGLGPRDIYDSIGGDTFVAYGISVFSRLPVNKWSNSGFRLHWFLNGGRLINHNNSDLSGVLDQLCMEHSIATGIGILFKHPVARFELNFTLPLAAHSSDSVRKGFQYGIGLSFL